MFKMQLRDLTEEGFGGGSLSKRFGVADREGPGCLALPSISGLVSVVLSQLTERGLWGSAGPIYFDHLFSLRERGSSDPLSVGQMSCSGRAAATLSTSPPWKHPELSLATAGWEKALVDRLKPPRKAGGQELSASTSGKAHSAQPLVLKVHEVLHGGKKGKKPHTDDITISGGI